MNVSMPTNITGGQAQPAASGGSPGVASPPSGVAAQPAVQALQQAAPAPAEKPSIEELRAAVERIRQVVTPNAQSLQFSVDEELGRTVVRVTDAITNEVIRQIPSEEAIAISKALDKLQGLLLRQQA